MGLHKIPLLEKLIECRKDYFSADQPMLKKGVYTVKTTNRKKNEVSKFNKLFSLKIKLRKELDMINKLLNSIDGLYISDSSNNKINIKVGEVEIILWGKKYFAKKEYAKVIRKINKINKGE